MPSMPLVYADEVKETVKQDNAANVVMSHFFCQLQFCGFWGSDGSHSTMKGDEVLPLPEYACWAVSEVRWRWLKSVRKCERGVGVDEEGVGVDTESSLVAGITSKRGWKG